MKPAGQNFPAVEYNDKKIDEGKGELMDIKNFPSFINKNSSKNDIKNYLKAISKNEKIKNPQFHAVISTKCKEHTKEELTKIADEFMTEMGYGKQPFILVFHNDTENNHIHIVSTRVDKNSGKKINDSFEKLHSQKAISKVMEKLFKEDTKKELNKLLSYKLSSNNQLKLLLEKKGYRIFQNKNDGNLLDIFKNGVCEKTINKNKINLIERKKDSRARQLKQILMKYSNVYSNKVFRVDDCRKNNSTFRKENSLNDLINKIEFESELQNRLHKDFGVEIIFNNKDDKNPFGYTLIDHKTGNIYKGSEIVKMKEIFEFTEDRIDKKLFEGLKNYNISDKEQKEKFLRYLHNEKLDVKEFMLFINKKWIDKEIYNSVRKEVLEHLKIQKNNDIKLLDISNEGGYYIIHKKFHFAGDLQSLIGEKEYQKFTDSENGISTISKNEENKHIVSNKDFERSINNMLYQFSKPSGAVNDPNDETKKRRRKKRR